ncbi:MAG: arsenate reductase [Saprospiraceae bacterium]|nr:arsenate reductase [Saprospiraceae bacterium]
MKKVFHLANCDTCQRIIKEIGAKEAACAFQDIKTEGIAAEDLDAWAAKVGSYEALFSRRALKFRSMGLHEQTLTEQDYRKLILEEYTFLKRPVIVAGDAIFVGNTAKVVAEAKKALQ